jgi:hypothetical protein
VFRLCEGVHFQERLVEEIRGVMKEKQLDCTSPGFRWTYDVLQELKYLEAFVMEVSKAYFSFVVTKQRLNFISISCGSVSLLMY